MRTLITGSTGFIGRHLTNYLAKKYPDSQILALCNHLPEDKDRFEHSNIDLWYSSLDKPIIQIIHCFKPDIVYHLAAIASPNISGHKLWKINTEITLNVLNSVEPETNFIFASTMNIYGEYPHQEEVCTTLYAASKKASEAIIDSYHYQGKIKTGICYRLAGIVGPNMTHGLIRDIVKKLKSDEPTLKLLKNTVKNYVHVDDMCKKITNENLNNSTDYKIIDISASQTLNTIFVANICMEELGIKKEIEFSNISYPGDILVSAKQSYENPTSEEAVRKTVRSYL